MKKVIDLLQCGILLIIVSSDFESSRRAVAQDSSFSLTPQLKERVILEAARRLEDYHVIPEIGQKMADGIRESLRNAIEQSARMNGQDKEEG